MAADQARARLAQALDRIEKRIREAEARPSREEIELLKKAREDDLKEIKSLREEIQQIMKNRQDNE